MNTMSCLEYESRCKVHPDVNTISRRQSAPYGWNDVNMLRAVGWVATESAVCRSNGCGLRKLTSGMDPIVPTEAIRTSKSGKTSGTSFRSSFQGTSFCMKIPAVILKRMHSFVRRHQHRGCNVRFNGKLPVKFRKLQKKWINDLIPNYAKNTLAKKSPYQNRYQMAKWHLTCVIVRRGRQ